MTKASFVLLMLCAIVFAQDNSLFLGLSTGTSRLHFDITSDILTSQTTENDDGEGNVSNTTTYTRERTNHRFSTSTRNYFGAIAGFRSFLQPELAIRGYAEYEYHPTTIKNSTEGDRNSKYYNITLGVDGMYYFMRDSQFGISAFAGVGAVYSRYDSYLVSAAGEEFKKIGTLGYMANVGVHVDVATHHGIELGARYIGNEVSKKAGSFVDDMRIDNTAKILQKPAFFVRYMYQF